MIEYVGNIDDFWSKQFADYVLPHKVNVGQRDHFHPNYSQTSAEILQAFDNEVPCKEQFMSAVGAQIGSISLICLEPGQIIPVHKDSFYKLRQDHNVDIGDCIRYLIFLQDWEMGHFVEFRETCITKWNKGDVWKFDSVSEHYAVNASQINFVTCQVNTF